MADVDWSMESGEISVMTGLGVRWQICVQPHLRPCTALHGDKELVPCYGLVPWYVRAICIAIFMLWASTMVC